MWVPYPTNPFLLQGSEGALRHSNFLGSVFQFEPGAESRGWPECPQVALPSGPPPWRSPKSRPWPDCSTRTWEHRSARSDRISLAIAFTVVANPG
jgi:hypothetical protein